MKLNDKVLLWGFAIRVVLIIRQTFGCDTYVPSSSVCGVEAIRGHFLTDENVRALIIGTN